MSNANNPPDAESYHEWARSDLFWKDGKMHINLDGPNADALREQFPDAPVIRLKDRIKGNHQ